MNFNVQIDVEVTATSTPNGGGRPSKRLSVKGFEQVSTRPPDTVSSTKEQ